MGLATASDADILAIARRDGNAVITLDADFHALLVLSGATGPSVVRIRIEGLRAKDLALLLAQTLGACGEELEKGAMISVTESGVRVRQLPLLR
jgi:predicted nuclease of predicted toxin-antitoxin system